MLMLCYNVRLSGEAVSACDLLLMCSGSTRNVLTKSETLLVRSMGGSKKQAPCF